MPQAPPSLHLGVIPVLSASSLGMPRHYRLALSRFTSDCRKLHRACILALSRFSPQVRLACHGTTGWRCHGSLPIAASSTELASWR
ncbi:MAG: hypothetical protein ACI31F_05530 [Muribaculaceae bacterium]